MVVLQLISHILIKEGDVREVHDVRWWQIKGMGESNMGTLLGLDKKAT